MNSAGIDLIIIVWTLLSAAACFQFALALKTFINYWNRIETGNGEARIVGRIFIAERIVLTITFVAFTLLGPYELFAPPPRSPALIVVLIGWVAAANIMAGMNHHYRNELERYHHAARDNVHQEGE